MKKTIKSFLIVICLAAFSGCQKIEVEPESESESGIPTITRSSAGEDIIFIRAYADSKAFSIVPPKPFLDAFLYDGIDFKEITLNGQYAFEFIGPDAITWAAFHTLNNTLTEAGCDPCVIYDHNSQTSGTSHLAWSCGSCSGPGIRELADPAIVSFCQMTTLNGFPYSGQLNTVSGVIGAIFCARSTYPYQANTISVSVNGDKRTRTLFGWEYICQDMERWEIAVYQTVPVYFSATGGGSCIFYTNRNS